MLNVAILKAIGDELAVFPEMASMQIKMQEEDKKRDVRAMMVGIIRLKPTG